MSSERQESEGSSLLRNLVLSVCELKIKNDSEKGSSEITPRLGARMSVSWGTSLLLFGGANYQDSYNDLYAIELERGIFREITCGGLAVPNKRYGHTLVTYNDYLVLFGGMIYNEQDNNNKQNIIQPPFLDPKSEVPWTINSIPSNDLFYLQVDKYIWNEADQSGTPPEPRAFHSATICMDCLFIFGGVTDFSYAHADGDLHIYNLVSNTWLTDSTEDTPDAADQEYKQIGTSPGPRYGHCMVTLPQSNRMILFGGADDDGCLYELQVEKVIKPSSPSASQRDSENDTPQQSTFVMHCTWSKIKPLNNGPAPRRFHSLVSISKDKLLVYGGLNLLKSSYATDLYVFDTRTLQWKRPLYDGEITQRAHADAVLHDKLLVFGGAKMTKAINEADSKAVNERQMCKTAINNSLHFLNVLEVKETTSEGLYKFKLVTVGDSDVGKSCLLTRFVQDQFSDSHVTTIGVDFKSLVTMVQGKVCTLQLWDTAGQERYSGVTSNYYRNADGFILVYDATRIETFEHIERWVSQIKQHHELGPSTVILLLGNKSDLEESIVVPESQARAYAESIGAIFSLTSAKTSANVDKALLTVANRLVGIRRKAQKAPKTAQTPTTESTTVQNNETIQLGASLPNSAIANRFNACVGGCSMGN